MPEFALDHETSFVVCCVEFYVNLFIQVIASGPYAITF